MSDKACPHCGGPLAKPRSESDHRRFFGLVNAAYDQWPEWHEFQSDSSEHLRAWLLCKAGYREATTIPIEDDAPEVVIRLATLAAEAAIKAAGSYAFVRRYAHGLAVISAKSIAWDKLGQKEFGPIRSAVEDVIKAEIGIDAETLLKEAQRAA